MDVNLLWSFYNTYIYQSITLDTLKIKHYFSIVVHLLSHFWLFVTPWTAECQASLSFTISKNFLKLMSIKSIMPSKHLISCHPLLLLPSIFPSIRAFSKVLALPSGGQSTGASALASVCPMNIQGWFPLGLTGLIPLKSKRLSRVFSNTQFKSINSSVLSLLTLLLGKP